MKREIFALADIYVPTKRRATLEQKRVDEIAAGMLENGQQTPILVRADRRTLRAGRGPAPAGGREGAGRKNHHRLPRRRSEALNGRARPWLIAPPIRAAD